MNGKLTDGIGRNVSILGIVSFFTDVSSEMIFPILPVFIISILGANQAVLGVIEGIADSAASITEIFSGYLSDVTGKRKQLVILGYGLSSVVKAGFAIATNWWQVLIMRGLERVGKGIRASPRDSIIADSSDENVRGKAFGFHRTLDQLGAVVGPLIAYFVLAWLGSNANAFRDVFWIALIPAFIAVLIIVLFVKEPEKEVMIEKRRPFFESLRQMGRDYNNFITVSVLFSLAYFSFAFFIVRAAQAGIEPGLVILLYTLYNALYAIASLPTGWLSDKIGRKPVIASSFVLYALVCIGFVFASNLLHFAILFSLYGVFVAIDDSVSKAYITDLSGKERRGMAMGAYNTAVGVSYLPASIVAGSIWVVSGAHVAFSIAAAIAVISALAFWKFCK